MQYIPTVITEHHGFWLCFKQIMSTNYVALHICFNQTELHSIYKRGGNVLIPLLHFFVDIMQRKKEKKTQTLDNKEFICIL